MRGLTEPPPQPRPATSDDEELLEAETTAILSEYSDAQRLLRVQDELRAEPKIDTALPTCERALKPARSSS